MQCWNCRAEVPEGAKSCLNCEADLTQELPLSPEVMSVMEDLLAQMPEDMRTLLEQYVQKSDTAEEFADLIMVGPCPNCESVRVGNCEHDPDYKDITLGRCFDCGQVWCTECDHLLRPGETECPSAQEHDAEMDEMFTEFEETDGVEDLEWDEEDDDEDDEDDDNGDGSEPNENFPRNR